MPYKRVDPVSDGEMGRKRYENHFTICQKLREIYAMTDDPEIKLRCRVAVAMAKRMHQALKDYRVYRESGENQEE